MRPLHLEFQAFGSYPGRENVDFAALARRGLFAVTGPTGTGKTTIFDAMVYALYGRLPGARQSDGEPRSHHAGLDSETFVDLRFEVDGRCYRVHRTPTQTRPKRRGTGTTEHAATASLVIEGEAGEEALATRPTDVNERCRELVGLDATQFQRVVLLPQGEFTRFLIATDAERESLLRQLFGGELFARATDWLKRRARELEERVRGVEADLAHHRANSRKDLRTVLAAWPEAGPVSDVDVLDDDQVLATIERLGPVHDERRRGVERLQTAATAATQARTTAESEARRFDDALKSEKELRVLESRRETVAANAARADASRRARPVREAASAFAEALKKAEDAISRRDGLRETLGRGFEALGRAMPAVDAARISAAVTTIANELAEQKRKAEEVARARAEADAARDKVTSAVQLKAQCDAQVDAESREFDALQRRVPPLEALAAALTERTTAHLSATERRDQRRELGRRTQELDQARPEEAAARSAYEQVMARFVATQAPRLARDLQPDEPCPVCGSTEHPAPARADGGEEVDHDTVDSAREAWAAKESVVKTLGSQIDALRAALGADADRAEAEFEAAVGATKSAQDESRKAGSDLAALRQEIEAKQAALGDALQRASDAASALTGARSTAETLREQVEDRAAAARGIDAVEVQRQLDLLPPLQRDAERAPKVLEAVTRTGEALRQAERQRASALTQSGFADEADALATVLDPAEETRFVEEHARWTKKLEATTTRLATLREQGIPAARPDVVGLVTAEEAAGRAATAAADAFRTAADALGRSHESLRETFDVRSSSANLVARRDVARAVFKTCNGEAGMKVKLERWVLAAELDRVTAQANAHLARMTGHRYRLARKQDESRGLELEVFDAHTGRPRPTASLSGGEQFQASLALALGLADVVSHGGTSSGKQFEALFVDEGFGSLDPDALDDAIDALTMIQATGRVVGAITHVETMKQRLHPGIEVSRLENGRGSTLTVNP